MVRGAPHSDCELFKQRVSIPRRGAFRQCDEDMYLNPPSVLIATVDKFVQVAHNHYPKSLRFSNDFQDLAHSDYSIRRMLGFEASENNQSPPPPDLIIQDELHLLSGPLGTVAGLFETVLDVSWRRACTPLGVPHRPKIVAATATIKGAERDAGLMYGKTLGLPTPTSTAKDNFFAVERVGDDIIRADCISDCSPVCRARSATEQPAASLLPPPICSKTTNWLPMKIWIPIGRW